jgi:hypothetical protein
MNINYDLVKNDGCYELDDCFLWYKDDKLHRDDGPAYYSKINKNKEWYKNGKKHREDGPAIIKGNYKVWLINGELHREDGPAIINGDYKTWYINDIIRNKDWVEKYLKIRKKHLLLGIIVSDKWKIREIILRW